MKVVILAGGVGSRLPDQTEAIPKPMIEIGGQPILWHIMSHFSHYGYTEFVVPVGYKGDQIRRYLMDYHTSDRDLRINVASGQVDFLRQDMADNWIVEVINTGIQTQTGGRILRLAPFLRETFMLTFGDGVSNVDLDALLDCHRANGRLATVTAVHPTPRFGELRLEGDEVVEFSEKPMEAGWVNGGYMVMEPGVFEYIEGDDTPLAPEPMRRLAKDGQLTAYHHDGFWQGVDTLRDKVLLEQLWDAGTPPWRMWDKAASLPASPK